MKSVNPYHYLCPVPQDNQVTLVTFSDFSCVVLSIFKSTQYLVNNIHKSLFLDVSLKKAIFLTFCHSIQIIVYLPYSHVILFIFISCFCNFQQYTYNISLRFLLSFFPFHLPCSIIQTQQFPHCQDPCYLSFIFCSEMVHASVLCQYFIPKS